MEVSGKSYEEKTKLLVHSYNCEPCVSEGNEVLADKFCQDCGEWLCSSCIGFHGRLKATRHHRIVDGSERCTPIEVAEEDNDVTERCVDHSKEFIKYHCITHKTFNCGHCVVKDHKMCDVSIINEVSKAFKNGSEIKNVQQMLQSLFSDTDKKITEITEKMTALKEHAHEAFRAKCNFVGFLYGTFLRRKDQLKKQVLHLMEKNDTRLLALESECERINENAQSIVEKWIINETNENQLYVEAVRAEPVFIKLLKDIKDVGEQIRVDEFKFQNNSLATDLYRLDKEIASLITVAGKYIDRYLRLVHRYLLLLCLVFFTIGCKISICRRNAIKVKQAVDSCVIERTKPYLIFV